MKKRIRDPIHGLITFDLGEKVDRAAWCLINTPEFQRLRRVKQLGVSEFTFPGASHTRFAHSIGVFHIARRLMKVAERDVQSNRRRACTALLAALLHDIGHGPFSHAFENAEKKRLPADKYRDHEHWTADIICRDGGSVRSILKEVFEGNGAIADDISAMLRGEEQNLYSSVVSSSFDADRLDYLRRDRMMTGTGAGAIDFDWLLDNLCVVEVPDSSGDEAEDGLGNKIEVFAFQEKALQAVEIFILARFHLYSQVYLHKATRGIEQLLTEFLLAFSNEVKKGNAVAVPEYHPLRRYYQNDTLDLESYLALDDAVVWSAIKMSADHGDGAIRNFAERICNRKLMKAVSIDLVNQRPIDRERRKYINDMLSDKLGIEIFSDSAPLSIYKDPNREPVKPHKRVYIRRDDGDVVDLTSLSKPVAALFEDQEILRYYFLKEDDRQKVLKIKGGSNA